MVPPAPSTKGLDHFLKKAKELKLGSEVRKLGEGLLGKASIKAPSSFE